MEQVSSNKVFGGWNRTYKHASQQLGCDMVFTVYLPPDTNSGAQVPAVLFLSGLTCTNENFIIKAGAQRVASELGIALIAPDTSPRGLGIPGEDDDYDFGTGAGFYLDALEEKWKAYRMYSYVTVELVELLQKEIPRIDMARMSIMGHSMGGHGALVIGLRNPTMFKSISAFAPICNPTKCQWGQKVFTGYLGAENMAEWVKYDATELLKGYCGPCLPVLCDTGTADQFKDTELLPEALEGANSKGQVQLESRLQDGYDHSYFFVSTFVEDHLRFHAKALGIQ